LEDVPKGTVWLRQVGDKTVCLVSYISEELLNASGAGDIEYEYFNLI